MGVSGLWKLIEPCGKPVPIDTLENNILAVDISIWLHQVIKGFQDNKGSALANAHLLGLFHRLCKLLYYRIRPVFVFDGSVPQLKRETIARRNIQRNKLINEADRIQNLLLQSLAKEKVVQMALGTNSAELLAKSPSKGKSIYNKLNSDDMFKLPELSSAAENKNNDGNHNESDTSGNNTSQTDDSFDECNPYNYYNQNLQAINVKSSYFKNLPADVRHEILVDIKETRKQSSWGRLHELPSKSDDFSSFQMERLLKRRQVQESLEEAEKEMGGRSLTLNELRNFFTDEGIVKSSNITGARQISSNEDTRFLLVRELKKAATSKAENNKSEIQEPSCSTTFSSTVAHAPSSEKEFDIDLNLAIQHESKKAATSKAENNKSEILETSCSTTFVSTVAHAPSSEKGFDIDLELAIQLSLENSTVYDKNKLDFESFERVTLTKKQNQQLNNCAGLARTYMMEYAGMNDDDVNRLLRKTQTTSDVESEGMNEEKECNTNGTTQKLQSAFNKNVQLPIIVEDVASDTDSDLEEVGETFLENVKKVDVQKQKNKLINETNLEIVIDLTKCVNENDDIFADVFNQRKSEVELKAIGDLQDKRKKYNEKDVGVSTKKTAIKRPTKSNCEEVIEIPSEEKELNSINRKSSKVATPSKNKAITEFFETDYIIKRTPEKTGHEEENVRLIKSPFFVNKSPNSSKKNKHSSSSRDLKSPVKKTSKASKMLFEKPTSYTEDNCGSTIEECKIFKDDVIKEASKVLKKNNTVEKLQDLAIDIAKEKIDLEKERNRQDRMGMSITERMNSDCMHLLRLFGVPFIVAPMEAEAQCAYLDEIGLTNGTITDDSDIWLFGGRTVYKNFFAQNKHVLKYQADHIEKSFNVDRRKLIQLAILVGSDYTTGVHGIGTVTALEILASFSTIEKKCSDEISKCSSVLTTLRKFRDWMSSSKASLSTGNTAKNSLRTKLKNIELNEGFPNFAVVEAYLTPKIDDSTEAFSWRLPDVESLREFAKTNFGWTRSKTDDILLPVLKKINEKKSQAVIKNYFSVNSVVSAKQLKLSKRVQNAIDKMSKIEDGELGTNHKDLGCNLKHKKGKRKQSETINGIKHDGDTSKMLNAKIPKETFNVPNTKSTIPQREKTLQQMKKNKEHAVALLKAKAKSH